jgi:hypothetical protein
MVPPSDVSWFINPINYSYRADPVVCPDCNIEDSLSSNMRREIAENTEYTQSFLLSDSEFSGL